MSNITEHSGLYVGKVRHRRFLPIYHEFDYRLFMMSLDLDEVTSLFKRKWFCSVNALNFVSFMRKDFFGDPATDLKTAVTQRIAEYSRQLNLNLPVITRVTLVTQVRYFNIIFNPVSFYYCYDATGKLQAILSEITNTPWGERHHYVLPIGHDKEGADTINQKHVFEFDKQFHVSPFNPMAMQYRWVFSNLNARLLVHMDNTVANGQDIEKHFDATLDLNFENFNDNIAKRLIQFPFMTVKVVIGIYWQAFKLWFKRAPFYDHPNSIEKPSEAD